MRRRDFLRRSAAVLAGSAAMPGWLPSRARAQASRSKLKVGFIGTGGRARQLMHGEKLEDHADIVAVADCWLKRMEEAAGMIPGGDRWVRYQDYRRMLEKEKLDAVFVATTTHARARICIHAMQAGLDVYAEKPVSLTVEEGRALVRAARKLRRVLQVGTQQRSIPINVWASRLVREGGIGSVREVIACNFIGPEVWSPQPGQPVPEGLDWDAWCNQTELRPYHRDLHLEWARWKDYDAGGRSWGVSGWGTHALDQVQCALGTDDTGPVEIWPEEPGPQGRVTMRYANGVLLKCHRPKPPPDRKDYRDLGAEFIGDRGRIDIQRGHCVAEPAELLKDAPPDTPAPAPGETVEHIRNFFECIAGRGRPNADIEIAHRATTVCALINICRDLGRRLRWDPAAERFVDDPEADAMLSRPRRKGYELPEV